MSIIRNENELNHVYNFNEMYIDKPTVVLLHGLYGDLNNLNVIERSVNLEFNTLRVDLVNHGKSFYRDYMDYNEMAADVKHVCDKYNIKRVIVIGHSMGGKVAMTFAHNYQNIIDGTVILDIAPVVYGQRGMEDILEILTEIAVDNNINDFSSAQKYLKEHLPLGVALFLSKSFTMEETHKFLFNTPVLKSDFYNISMWSKINYDKPVLFIAGAKSNYITPEREESIKEQFSNYELVRIEDATHWLHAEKPSEVNAAIQNYLKKIVNN